MPTVQNMSRRQVGWSHTLQSFPCTWVHRAGKNNVADPISRRPGHDQPLNIYAVTRGTLAQPIVISPFQDEILAGYESDPWFDEPQSLKNLTNVQGIWIKGTQTCVPNHRN